MKKLRTLWIICCLALWIRDQIRVVLNSMLYTKTHWKIVFLYVWLLYMQGRRRNDCNVLSNFLDYWLILITMNEWEDPTVSEWKQLTKWREKAFFFRCIESSSLRVKSPPLECRHNGMWFSFGSYCKDFTQMKFGIKRLKALIVLFLLCM